MIIRSNETDLPELTYFSVGDWTFHLTPSLTLSSILLLVINHFELPKLTELKTGMNSFYFTKQLSLSSKLKRVSFTDLPALDIIVALNRSFEYTESVILQSMFH